MKRRFFLYTLAFTALVSCDQLIYSYWNRKAEENNVPPYNGVYTGNYYGDESGTLSIQVGKNGAVSVTRISSFGTEESLAGSVENDGALQSVTQKSGFTLLGNFSAKSGAWKLTNWAGTWSVVKQY